MPCTILSDVSSIVMDIILDRSKSGTATNIKSQLSDVFAQLAKLLREEFFRVPCCGPCQRFSLFSHASGHHDVCVYKPVNASAHAVLCLVLEPWTWLGVFHAHLPTLVR